jgi:hypothetical protein
VNCCCSVARQPRLAGEKELFTSRTATMSSTSRTMKSTQRMIIVLLPPFNIRPEYLQDRCRCRQWYRFRIFSSSTAALCTAIFCCPSAEYDWMEHSSSTRMNACYRAIHAILRENRVKTKKGQSNLVHHTYFPCCCTN